MKLQIHPVSNQSTPNADGNPPSEGLDMQPGGRDSVSVARLTMIGTLGAALVTGIVTIVSQFSPPHDSEDSAPKEIPSGISYDYTGDYAKSEVAVNGSATDDVDEVAVLIGPRPFGGKFGGETVKVVDGAWDVTVKTDPNLPKPYVIQAIPHLGYRNSAVGANTIEPYSFGSGDTSTPPPPSPQDPLQCAMQYGPSCFAGPGWGGAGDSPIRRVIRAFSHLRDGSENQTVARKPLQQNRFRPKLACRCIPQEPLAPLSSCVCR